MIDLTPLKKSYILPFILSIALLILIFLLKLFVNRKVNFSDFILALNELPVDIFFLALTFCIFYVTTEPTCGIIQCVLVLILTIISVFVYRFCEEKLINNSLWWIILLFLNLSLSIYFILNSINLNMNMQKQKLEMTK